MTPSPCIRARTASTRRSRGIPRTTAWRTDGMTTRSDRPVATMRGMATGSCPNCGTARVGSFRYCRSCGLDYDAEVPKAPTPAPAVLTPVPEAAPVVLPIADDAQQQPAGDVIVIQVLQLKLWAGVVVGGLIGSMLAGAIVVPFFGEEGVLLGSVAAIVIVVVSAWLGMRFVRLTAKRRPAVGSEDPG